MLKLSKFLWDSYALLQIAESVPASASAASELGRELGRAATDIIYTSWASWAQAALNINLTISSELLTYS